jgi:hypothetical protein
MIENRYFRSSSDNLGVKFGTADAVGVSPIRCFASSVPGMKLTIIGQQSNLVAARAVMSPEFGKGLSQCLSCFGIGQCSALALRTTFRQ